MTTKKLLLQEAAAWRALAVAVDLRGVVVGVTDRVGSVGPTGLCNILERRENRNAYGVDEAFDGPMFGRLSTHFCCPNGPAYIDEKGESGARVLFCLFMSLEADDEARGSLK